MAVVEKRGDGQYRARVRKTGFPPLSKTFINRSDALTWAKGVEVEMERGSFIATSKAQTTTFKSYRCADGTEFIAGFFQDDARAHLQLDGKPATLNKRLTLSGSRYQGRGVTLKITKAGLATLKRGKLPVTTCEST